MSERLPLKQNITLKKIWPTIKKIFLLILIIGLAIFFINLPEATYKDFSILRSSLSNYGTRQRNTNLDLKENNNSPKSASETAALEKLKRERMKYVNESRARMYVESATNDYYKGSYDEALRRLNRALLYDPNNFTAFKLSGQIFFENNKYRKAFNNLSMANQLSNDDKTLARDLDVLRKLLRHNRLEINKLRHTVNTNPDNKIAKARLKELEERAEE